MLSYALPILLVVLSNVFYNISQKSTPAAANPYVSLLMTYLTAGLATLFFYLLSRPEKSFAASLGDLNWTSYLLGLAIVGLELGYLLAYRAGWDISIGSLVANILLAIILIPVGVIFYQEGFNSTKIVGIVFCILGLIMINR